jgi:uncharacterized protein (DUF58 family)
MMAAASDALPEEPAYLDYRVRGRAANPRPGKHAARHAGQGGDFRAFRPFWQLPDARQIDIRRSITDPFADVLVRQTRQRSSVTLIVAADVSRSMQPAPDRSSIGAITAIADAACRSALRAGDAFGLLAFDQAVRKDLAQPPTRQRGAAWHAVSRLAAFTPDGRGADGITQLAAHLPGKPCLVLLVSDFLMPPASIDAALLALARHTVVPIILRNWCPDALPRAGLLRLADAETGRARLLLLRPALRRRWQAESAAWRGMLDRLFLRHGRRPFHATGAIDLAALSRHLMDG